jgi:ABC-type antimicrobial peptide transport system permease subunit
MIGLLALLLSSIGIYGVMAYSVARRTREIGIRMALSAHSQNVLSLVVRQGMALVMSGVAFGLIAAFAVTRLIGSLSRSKIGRLRRRGRPVCLPRSSGSTEAGADTQVSPTLILDLLSLLFGVTAADPATFVNASGVDHHFGHRTEKWRQPLECGGLEPLW